MKSAWSAEELEQNAQLAHTEIVIAALFLTLTWIAVGLRFRVRSHILHTTGLDDWLVLFTQILFTAYCAVQLVILDLVPGISPATFALVKLVTSWFISGATLYAFAMTTLKLSLGFFFLRVVTSAWQRNVVYVVMVAATIANLVESFYLIFMCGNPHNYAEKILLDKCAPQLSMAFVAYGQNTINTLTDIILAVLPFFLLWKTKMKRAQKWTAGLILTLATAGCISSIVRFVYISRILQPKTSAFFKTIKPLTIICIVELGSGILACSIATLRPLFSHLVNLTTIRYPISRLSHSLHNTNPDPELGIQKGTSNDTVSSQDSGLHEIQHARNASMRESFFSDADSQTDVSPEQREKSSVNSSVESPRVDEGSEVGLV